MGWAGSDWARGEAAWMATVARAMASSACSAREQSGRIHRATRHGLNWRNRKIIWFGCPRCCQGRGSFATVMRKMVLTAATCCFIGMRFFVTFAAQGASDISVRKIQPAKQMELFNEENCFFCRHPFGTACRQHHYHHHQQSDGLGVS